MKREIGLYPIVIVQDRYMGAYSGGKWLAIARARALENGAYRIVRVLEGDAFGEDCDASDFWLNPPDWIAVGETPDLALAALKEKVDWR